MATIAQQGKTIKGKLKGILDNIVHWEWTKKLLHWIIISAGTMSECVFLIASLWVSINANVHQFVLLFVNENTTMHITELATTAYVALPECIVGLAVVTTLSHIRVWMYNKKDYRAVIWSVLYGLPTIVFLVLSLITLGCSVASVTFQMPTYLVVTRALAGYMFAFTSLLYTQLGVPQEKDRLQEKDDYIVRLKDNHLEFVAQLRLEKDTIITQLQKQIADITTQFKQENATSLAALGNDKDMVIYRLQQATNSHQETIRLLNEKLEIAREKIENAGQEKQQLLLDIQRKGPQETTAILEGKPQEIIEWLRSTGRSTISISEVNQKTNLSKRKMLYASKHGGIRHTKNEEIVYIDALIPWIAQEFSISNSEQNTDKIIRLDERVINE